MIENCYINSSLNLIAMILIAYYSVFIYIRSKNKKVDGIIYFLIVMTCSLRIGTEIDLLLNPKIETFEVYIPLVRNFAIAYAFKNHSESIK